MAFDSEHYGMKSVKERLIEFLAVQKVKNIHYNSVNSNQEEVLEDEKIVNNDCASGTKKCDVGLIKAPLLCLVGPPGVGKTSIAKFVNFIL